MNTVIWSVIILSGIWVFVEVSWLLFLCIFKFIDKRINGYETHSPERPVQSSRGRRGG